MKYRILRTRLIPKNYNPIFETSICLLKCRCGGFLFQLRDDRNDIKFPGSWGLFGGTIENGESPIDSVVREINEELNVLLAKENFLFLCLLLHEQITPVCVENVFYANISDFQDNLLLNEGQDMECLDYKTIISGSAYSKVNLEKRPVARPILILFENLDLDKLDISTVI